MVSTLEKPHSGQVMADSSRISFMAGFFPCGDLRTGFIHNLIEDPIPCKNNAIMLEIPESNSVGNQAHVTLTGKKIREVQNASSPHKFAFLYGDPAGYRTLLSKKTVKDPCPNCGGAIVKEAYLGGAVYFCPSCQPL